MFSFLAAAMEDNSGPEVEEELLMFTKALSDKEKKWVNEANMSMKRLECGEGPLLYSPTKYPSM